LFKDFIANDLRSIEIITYTTLVFGVLLGIAVLLDKNQMCRRGYRQKLTDPLY
jgi:hypothetical protein